MQYSCVNDTSEDMTAIKKRFHRGQKIVREKKLGRKKEEKVNSIEIDTVLIFIIYY